MANGFPKPREEAVLPLGSSALTHSEPGALLQPVARPNDVEKSTRARAFSGSALPGARLARRSPLRSRPLLCGLALLALSGAGAGLASHTFGADRAAPSALTTVSAPSLPEASTPTPRLSAPSRVSLAAPIGTATVDSDFEANAYQGVGPGVPEAYTGDPAGQALWDKTVEEDQQTIQPDDLSEEPPPPMIDYSKIPAYQALKLDADGNVNE